MTKRDYFKSVDNIVRAAISDQRDQAKWIAGAYDRKSALSADHWGGVVYPEIRQREKSLDERYPTSIIANALKEIEGLTADYVSELQADDALRGEDITADAQLLNAPIRLSQQDLEAILERNQENKTMLQLVLRYAEEHNIPTKYNYVGNSAKIKEAQDVPDIAKTAMRWYDEKSSHVYDRLFGDGSDLRKNFDGE